MARAFLSSVVVVMLTGCAGYISNQNFDRCFLDAERMTATLADSKVQRIRRDNYTYACMKANGFDLIGEDADKAQASSYKLVRWF
jgi:hypothetical protein